MKKVFCLALGITAAAYVPGALANHKSGHSGGCVLAGGEATMITEDLAKFMAEAALKNSIAAHNWTASGDVKIKCDTANGLPHCVARRRACG